MTFRLSCLALTAALFTSLSNGQPTPPPAPSTSATAPNIVVILVDDMGYGDPQCYNNESKIATPHIDSLASAGMRFTDAHAPGPLCHMSRYGLMTGRYPFRTNVRAWPRRALIEPDQTTIASLLKSRGYQTAMVGKWHLGFDENGYDNPLPGGPVDRGFDSYFGIRASTDIPPYFYIRGNRAVTPPTDHIDANSSQGWSSIQGAFWRAGGIAPDLKLQDVLPRFTREAVDVIQRHAQQTDEEPLFLYLAYPAPHTPWLPDDEFVGKTGAGMYGDFATMVDAMVGRVLKALDEAELADDTLVVFTSDNGPVWYGKDVERFAHDSSGGLRGMKADAWECGHRMPFIVRWPRHVAADSVSHQLVCFTDLMATFAEIAGARLAPGEGPDSISFLHALRGAAAEQRRTSVVMQTANGTMTIRSGRWKLIDQLGSGGFSEPKRVQPGPSDPPGQLYDLSKDLGETQNLYQQEPAIVAQLLGQMKQMRESESTRQ